jgi:hypothetical protein
MIAGRRRLLDGSLQVTRNAVGHQGRFNIDE